MGLVTVCDTLANTHRAYGPYALCVTIFNNMSRRLILGAYCVILGAHRRVVRASGSENGHFDWENDWELSELDRVRKWPL